MPCSVPFPSSASGAENIAVSCGDKRTRRNALMDVTNGTDGLLPGRVNPKPSSVCNSPPRITILANPARARTSSIPPAQVAPLSHICQASPLRITILVNPARTRSLPSIQNTPMSTTRHNAPTPPRITILTNPARNRLQLSSENSRSTPNASAATPTPKRSPTPISILKASAPAPSRRAVAAATPAPSKRARHTPSSAPTTSKPTAKSKGEGKLKATPLPKIVVHEPGSWDVWTDVNQPGTSHGKMLDVPAVSGCGKLHEDDCARFYPREHTADQIMRRLRKMLRSGNRRSTASRRECARQRKQAAAGTTSTTIPTPTVIPASTEDTPIITQPAGDTAARECLSPMPETDNDSNPSILIITFPSV